MQNKPNFQNTQTIVTLCKEMAYENKHNWTLSENKPNSKPNKANSNPIKANKMPKQTQTNPDCSVGARGLFAAAHRLGDTSSLAGEFAKMNGVTILRNRLFWMGGQRTTQWPATRRGLLKGALAAARAEP